MTRNDDKFRTAVTQGDRDYVNFTGGIAVMNVGHSHPKAGVDLSRLRQSGQRHPDFDAAGDH
jgi:acetylornithine/succinyldiaminopimelate/putrescine aminotransferase